MGLKKKLLKVFGRKKKNTATAKTAKTSSAGSVLYIPTSRTPASRYMSSSSLFRPVSYSGSSSGYSSGRSGFSGSGFSGSSTVSSGLSGLSGRSGRNSSGNTYVHVPGKYQTVFSGTPARLEPGAMIARVGDIIAYTDVYDNDTYQWLGKVKSLTPDGVVVEQRGQFSNTTNVAGKTVTLEKTTRNKRVFKFKRISPKDVKQYERQGWKFSHAYGNNGGNGGGNGSSANRSLLRGLKGGKFITFMYKGKPVFGQIDRIDTRTGEVHMKKNPQGMYNQNLLGIQIPTPGSEAEIKFRPSANSQITRLRDTLPGTYRVSLQERGFQNLSQGFKLSNNNGNKMSMNFIVKQALGEHARTFETWDAQLQIIKGITDAGDKKNAIQEFVVNNLVELEKLDALIDASKNKPQFTKAASDMKKKLLGRIKTLYPKSEDGDKKFEEMMADVKATLAERRPSQGWFGWGLGKAAATAGLLYRAGAAASSYGRSLLVTPSS